MTQKTTAMNGTADAEVRLEVRFHGVSWNVGTPKSDTPIPSVSLKTANMGG